MSQLNYSIDFQACYLQQSIWLDNMSEPKTLLRSCLSIFAFIFCITLSVPAMSYEEPDYRIVQKTEVYEVRLYAKAYSGSSKLW